MATRMYWKHHDDPLDLLIGESAPMKRVKEAIRRVAATGRHVVLRGETGVGKGLIARILHERSGSLGPFVATNLGAVPAAEVGMWLFGSESACDDEFVHSGKGRFEKTHRGTLFLDEIGTMPESVHGRFAEVIRTRRLRGAGTLAVREADVRVIAGVSSSVVPLPAVMNEALAGVIIDIPPLRERGADALLIARALLAREQGGQTFSAEAEKRLLAVDLPFNVRQLGYVVARASAVTTDVEIPASALI